MKVSLKDFRYIQNIKLFLNSEDFGKSVPLLGIDELIIFVCHRNGSVSYTNITDKITSQVVKNNITKSFLLFILHWQSLTFFPMMT